MATYRTELLDRLVAMEHEALDAAVAALLPDRTGIDAQPLLFYTQSSLPYVVHAFGPSAPENVAQDLSIRRYTIGIRFVIGHFTQGYKGQSETITHELIPLMEDYLIKHPQLITDAGSYTEVPGWLHPLGIAVLDTGGIEAFPLGGINDTQIGEQLDISVPIVRTTEFD